MPLPAIAHGGDANLKAFGLNSLPLANRFPELLILTLDALGPCFVGVKRLQLALELMKLHLDPSAPNSECRSSLKPAGQPDT
ncbi:hypothetical protein [Wenzhouxiangella sediminis]|uniref:hypothetical protein n=1 Tax=Wenzhouxiangella sediminis TaxID=1792836 RepID=UPI001FECD999|nr:hypothetical protein [Wenzhouxiangella sediminis]